MIRLKELFSIIICSFSRPYCEIRLGFGHADRCPHAPLFGGEGTVNTPVQCSRWRLWLGNSVLYTAQYETDPIVWSGQYFPVSVKH